MQAGFFPVIDHTTVRSYWVPALPRTPVEKMPNDSIFTQVAHLFLRQ